MKIAVLMPTLSCQMDCEFCINELTMQTFEKKDVSEIKKILEDENFESVIIGGGEPLLWKYGVFNFIDEIKHHNYLVQVGTNGILLEDNFHNKSEVNRLILPLESLNSETHNKMRPSKVNHHQIILKRIEKLQQKENSLTLSTVITERNKQDIFELAEYFRKFHEYGHKPIHAWHLYQFVPTGRGGEFNKDILLLNIQEYDQICNAIIKLNLPFKVFKRRNMPQSKTVTFFWKENNTINRNQM